MSKRRSLDKEEMFCFPEEILAEILSWLEAEYLLRCKCVCKVWYSVILGKLLVDMQVVRNGILHSDWIQENIMSESKYCRGLLLETIESFSPVTPSDMAAYRIRDPTKFRISNPTTYRIRNPTTKRILNLPRPHNGVIYKHIFQYPSTSSYYVVSVFFHHVWKRYTLALIDLGGHSNDLCLNADDLSWRIVKIPVFDMLSRQGRYHFSYCISSEGILHILTSPMVGLNNPKIMCVDLVKQTCEILKVPQNLYFNYKELKIQSWINKPAVVFVREEKLIIWVLEDYKKQKWADTKVISLPFLTKCPRLKTEVPYIHRDSGDEEDILVYSPVNWCFYTIKSGSICFDPPPYMRVPATLVSLRGMQPEKK
ncbi:hypothetical protein AgCh_003008 [Apium graveolens]